MILLFPPVRNSQTHSLFQDCFAEEEQGSDCREVREVSGGLGKSLITMATRGCVYFVKIDTAIHTRLMCIHFCV